MLILKIIVIVFLSTNFAMAQAVFESEQEPTFQSQSDLVEETIMKISPSKRVFLISNSNASIGKGDFISIIRNDELTARAIVAKTAEGSAGIKIIKIYSLNNWKFLRENLKVKILRGDDSYYHKAVETVKEKPDSAKVLDDDELFERTILDEDLELQDKSNRVIKTDNIIGAAYGRFSTIDYTGASQGISQVSLNWSYQFTDNVWGEIFAGQSVLDEYPKANNTTGGLTTSLINITARVKYPFAAPYYSYILPYVGFQYIIASSGDAGNTDNATVNAEEIQQVEKLEERKLVFGVTILKRLVPGWFVAADLGTDIFNIGLSLEF